MAGGEERSKPVLIASALAGSWRAGPPAAGLTHKELGRIAPLLVGSGAAALAWWKVRRSTLRDCAAAAPLRDSYHTQTLQSALQEWEVAHVFTLLRDAGVEPVLLKGRAAAGLYPEPGLRPPGDIDLCVRPEQSEGAKAVLWGPGRRGTTVTDLTHDDSALTCAGGWDGLYARTRLVELGGTPVRVLGREDLLRFLSLHLLRHSAYRPLWLCDVAAAAESAPGALDWEVALGLDPLKRNWVLCVLDLARRLLGARLDHAPAEVKEFRAPAWLAEEVLRQWERPCTADRLPRELMSVSLRHPTRVLPALASRWPDPIRTLVETGRPIGPKPGLLLKASHYLAGSARFVSRAAK